MVVVHLFKKEILDAENVLIFYIQLLSIIHTFNCYTYYIIMYIIIIIPVYQCPARYKKNI